MGYLNFSLHQKHSAQLNTTHVQLSACEAQLHTTSQPETKQTHISVPVGLKKCRRKLALFWIRKHLLKAVFCSLKTQRQNVKILTFMCVKKRWSRRCSYSTTSTEAWILESSSRLWSKLMRTTFFWKHKTKAGELRSWGVETEQSSAILPDLFESPWRTSPLPEKKLSDFHHSRESQIKEEDEYIPSSAWVKPLSRRIFADSSVKLLFPTISLQVFTFLHIKKKVISVQKLRSFTFQQPSHKYKLLSSCPPWFSHTRSSRPAPASTLGTFLSARKRQQWAGRCRSMCVVMETMENYNH